MQYQSSKVETKVYEAECEWRIENMKGVDWRKHWDSEETNENYLISNEFKFKEIDVSW